MIWKKIKNFFIFIISLFGWIIFTQIILSLFLVFYIQPKNIYIFLEKFKFIESIAYLFIIYFIFFNKNKKIFKNWFFIGLLISILFIIYIFVYYNSYLYLLWKIF